VVGFRKILPLVLLISALALASCIQPSPTPHPFITVIDLTTQMRTEALGIAMLWEDFEDGDYTNGNRWHLASSDVIYDRREVYESSFDHHYLLLEGPQEEEQGHETGLNLNLKGNSILGWIIPDYNGWTPNLVSFNIFSWSPRGNSTGAFLLKGYHPGDDSEVTAIEFFVDKNGEFSVNGASYGPISQQWHLIEFRQINWEPDPTIPIQFNLFIDDVLVGECLQFLNPIRGFYKIEVYNFHRGHTGYDNIIMINEADSERIHYCGQDDIDPLPEPPEPPPPAPLPDSQTGSPETDPDAYIATAKQNAACRQGPANEYPEVDFVEEGFSAPVIGRNDDDNWFVITGPNWGEDCWIWQGMLETTGNINPVPVLPDPLLVLPDSDGSDSDEGDSDSTSACLVLQMAGGTKCISPCPPGANPGTPCTP